MTFANGLNNCATAWAWNRKARFYCRTRLASGFPGNRGLRQRLILATPLIDFLTDFEMRTLHKTTKASCLALALVVSGCWMGGNTRSNYRPAAPVPNAPIINTPRYGPSAPTPYSEPAVPNLDGPVLEGPAFPQSRADEPASGFDRKRHSQQLRAEDSPAKFRGNHSAADHSRWPHCGPATQESPANHRLHRTAGCSMIRQ